MSVSAAVQKSEGFDLFSSVLHVDRQNQPPRSVIAAHFEDGICRRRLKSCSFYIRCLGGFAPVGLLAAAIWFRMHEWMMRNVAFVAADRRRTRLRQMPILQTLEAQALILVEFPACRRTQLTINWAVH